MSEVLTVPEAAQYLRVSVSQLYAMCRSGLIPCVRLSPSAKGRIRIDRSALEDFMRTGPAVPTPAHARFGRILVVQKRLGRARNSWQKSIGSLCG